MSILKALRSETDTKNNYHTKYTLLSHKHKTRQRQQAVRHHLLSSRRQLTNKYIQKNYFR